jgi:large subunit ribosomal protein L12
MEYAYATCILNETGEEINERNLVAVLEAAGCEVQESRVKAIVAALEDVEIDDVTGVDLDAIGADDSGPAQNGTGSTGSQLTAIESAPGDATAPSEGSTVDTDSTDDTGNADSADDTEDVASADGAGGGLWETADVEQSETATSDEG